MTDKALSAILMQLIMDFRVVTWGADDDAQIEIRRMFNDQLQSKLESQLIKNYCDSSYFEPIFKAMIPLIKQLTKNHQLNTVWVTRLMVDIYRSNTYLKQFFYQHPLNTMFFKYSDLLMTDNNLECKRKGTTVSLQQGRELHRKLMEYYRKTLDSYFRYMPSNSELYKKSYRISESQDQQLLDHSRPSSETNHLRPTLALIVIFFIYYVLYVSDKGANSFTPLTFIGGCVGLTLGLRLIISHVSAGWTVLKQHYGPSLLQFKQLGSDWQQDLEAELKELEDVSGSIGLGQTKFQSSIFNIKHSSTTLIPPPSAQSNKDEKVDKVELSSSTSRDNRSRAYLPQVIWGGIQPSPKERVTWRIPFGKSTKQVTWYVNSGQTSETLFRLWSKKINQGYDPYQSYYVYFNRQPLPFLDDICQDIFYINVSWGRVVGPKNEAGIVPIPKSERSSATTVTPDQPSKKYPPKQDCNHVLREAEFKVKSFVKPVSLWRIPLYPYDKQTSIIENGDGTEASGSDYTLLVPGIPVKKHG